MYIDGEIRLLKQRVKRFVMQLAEKNELSWVGVGESFYSFLDICL